MTIHLPCKLISKKGKKTEIEIEGQKIEISSEYLPKNIEGDTLQICFLLDDEAKNKETNIAKQILEEILNGK